MSDVILVLHSNPVTATSFASTLDEIGFSTALPTDIEMACEMIRISPPDVVLLDGAMALNDLTLSRRLRLCSPQERLQIILLIPQGEDDVSRFLCGTDADDYLQQPYQIKELQARLMLRLSVKERSQIEPLPHFDRQLADRGSLSTAASSRDEISQFDIATDDLRVLLSVVEGYCLLFNETAERVEPAQEKIISGLLNGNHRLVDMVHDLIDFSQLNSGNYRFDFAEHDICQILGLAVQELSPLLAQRNIRLLDDCLNLERQLFCDHRAIKRAFYNILKCAINFTPEGCEILLDLHECDGELRITVVDNGPGIEPERLSSLFDEYTPIPPEDPKAGSGLGLVLCKKIINAHHGRIWAERFMGKGNSFTFCLPV